MKSGTDMVMSEPDPDLPRKRRKALGLYLGLSIVTTSAASVILSAMGYLPFDPFTALIAGTIGGFAFALFQITYMRFVGHTSLRIQEKKPMLE